MESGQIKISGLDYVAVRIAALKIAIGDYSDAIDHGVELRDGKPKIHTFTIHKKSKLDPK